jgi:hypothetical protein
MAVVIELQLLALAARSMACTFAGVVMDIAAGHDAAALCASAIRTCRNKHVSQPAFSAAS